MTFRVSEKDFGLRDTLRRTGKLSTANLRIGMERVGIRWLKLVDEGFKNERDPYGNPWQPLARRTIRKKEKLGARRPEAILQATGKMRRSFGFTANSRSLSFFNDRVFDDGHDASIHQFGGLSVGGFEIPARPMLPFENDIPEEWWNAAINSIRYALGRYMDDV